MRSYLIAAFLGAAAAIDLPGLPSIPGLPDFGSLGNADDAFGALTDYLKDLIGPSTVDEVDLEMYTGRWYQTYASLIPTVTYERNGVCITADYGLLENGDLSVYNANRVNEPDGKLNEINGTATVPNSDEPGKLTVEFDGGTTFPGDADYWILALGPVKDSQYQYSIVSEPLRTQLFVLARNVTEFYADYNDEVRAFLKDKGFTLPFNQPIKTYQEDDCEYAPEPSS